MKKATETALVRSCLELLQLHGIKAWRQNQGAMAGEHKGKRWFLRFAGVKGISDIIGILPDGRFLAIECKLPGNEPTDDQNAFLSMIADSGGEAWVVYGLDTLKGQIDSLAQPTEGATHEPAKNGGVV